MGALKRSAQSVSLLSFSFLLWEKWSCKSLEICLIWGIGTKLDESRANFICHLQNEIMWVWCISITRDFWVPTREKSNVRKGICFFWSCLFAETRLLKLKPRIWPQALMLTTTAITSSAEWKLFITIQGAMTHERAGEGWNYLLKRRINPSNIPQSLYQLWIVQFLWGIEKPIFEKITGSIWVFPNKNDKNKVQNQSTRANTQAVISLQYLCLKCIF